MKKNLKYSHRDFTGKSLANVPLADINDTEIIGACFAQEQKKGEPIEWVVVFPKNMTGVTFTRCNLDNVFVPDACTVIGGCHRLITQQNDRCDWVLNVNTKLPVEPVDKKMRLKTGLTLLPKDIPSTPLTDEQYEQMSKILMGNTEIDRKVL